MPKFQFTFVTTGFDIENDRQLLTLEDAFSNGGEIGVSYTQGRNEIGFFDQKAPTALEAMKKAYRKLQKTLPGVQVQFVDEDLVSIRDIANRIGESKKEIRALAKNCGTFPTPIAILGGGKCIWRWQDVYICLDAIRKYEWLNTGKKLKDYTDTLDSGGEHVDRQSIAAFTMLLDLEQTRKQGQKKTTKKKPAKKNSR